MKNKIGLVSQELAALTEQASASTQQLMASSSHVNDSFLHSTNMAQNSRVLALAGAEKIDGLERRIESIHKRSLRMEYSVAQLIDSSEQIKTIVRIVQNISGQTKLLSLNAGIEAARAGQHGAGFAVVAGEVKKLSESTVKAVKQISDFIQQSSDRTQEVVQSIGEVKHLVGVGQQESGQTREMFNQILLSLDSSLDELNKVESELDALVKGIGEIGSATMKVASSAEDLNTATQNF
ncbi:methyl-accepting chemotaxis protein [Paenibacillus radicis (ex Xue et al. 2023)]|uniref:methyl-accepting chemotaxis protein n=1 Tax=Paenibacillus radicis (ex Xue et al. 2023) TaxID=2972489 RepID=UPI003AF32B48